MPKPKKERYRPSHQTGGYPYDQSTSSAWLNQDGYENDGDGTSSSWSQVDYPSQTSAYGVNVAVSNRDTPTEGQSSSEYINYSEVATTDNNPGLSGQSWDSRHDVEQYTTSGQEDAHMSDAAWTTGEQSGDAYPWANNEDFAPRQAPHATVADYPHHESQMPSQYPDQPVSAQSYDAATTSANANERLGTPEVGISRQSTGNVSNATSTEVHMPKPVDHDSPDGDAMDDGQTTEQSTVRPSTTSGPADLNSAIDNPWRGPVDDTRHYLPQEQEVSHMGGDDRTARQDCRATYGHGETDFEEPASTGYTGTASSWGIHHQDRAQATHDNQTSEQQVVYCERYDSTPYGTSADASSSVPGGVMYRSGFPVQVPSNYPYATELPELDSSEASESATEQHERGHRARHDHDQYYADASGSATGREEGRERHHRGDRDRDAAGRHRRRERDRDVAEASESATRMDERQRHRRHDRDRDHAEASGSSSGRHHHKDRDRRGDKKAGKKGRY